MKVAYVFSTSGHTASYKLGKMILPQLEGTTGYPNGHGAEVVGMFFFDDNNFVLREGDPLGERLSKVALEQNILLMMCDQCALERGLAEGTPGSPGGVKPKGAVAGAVVGCFPDLYEALSGNPRSRHHDLTPQRSRFTPEGSWSLAGVIAEPGAG